MSVGRRQFSESERSAILDVEIRRYVAVGYRVTIRTPTTAQLVKPKKVNVTAAFLWLLICGVGVVVYLFHYLLVLKDTSVYLSVDEGGTISRG